MGKTTKFPFVPLTAMLLSAWTVAACRLIADTDGPIFDATGNTSSVSASEASSVASTGMDCGDLDPDIQSCGGCGHFCAVGQCGSGICQPVLLVDTQARGEYHRLLVDAEADGYLYWARYKNGEVFTAKKNPGSPVKSLAVAPNDGEGWIFDIAIQDDTLFFSDYSDTDQNPERGIYAVPKDGTAPAQLLGASGLFGVTYVRPIGERIFFDTRYDQVGFGWIPTVGGEAHPVAQYSETEPIDRNGGSFLTDGQYVYYSDSDLGIVRQFVSSGAPQPIYPRDVGDVWIAAPGGLLWSIPGQGVRQGSLDGVGEPRHLAEGADIRGWFVRDPWLYFSDGANIQRVRLDGTAPAEPVIEADGIVGALAADSISFYFAELVSGRIFRVSF